MMIGEVNGISEPATAIPESGFIMAGSLINPGRSATVTLKVLGDLSYPLYVLHAPVLFLLVAVGKRLPVFSGSSDPVLLALSAVVAAGVSWLILKLYDEPVRAWLGGLRHGRASPATAP